MGLCINCIYHRNGNEVEQPKPRCRDVDSRIKLTHVCVHPNHTVHDYITGESRFDSCYKWNGYEECLVFDDGAEVPPDNENEPTEPTNTEGNENTPTEPETPTEPTNEGNGD